MNDLGITSNIKIINNMISLNISGISDGVLLIIMAGFIVLMLAIIKALSKTIESLSKSTKTTKNKSKENIAKTITLVIGLGSSAIVQARNLITPKAPEFTMGDFLFWVLMSLIVFLAIVIGILFRSLITLIKIEKGDDFEEETSEHNDIFRSLKLTDNVPIEHEIDVMLDHEYDGIRELDNSLPPWWKYLFYATIIFSVIYLIRFHITGGGQLSHEEYAEEMALAEAQKAEFIAAAGESITEENVSFLADESSINLGKAIYDGNCATCHGQLGEGGAGPNLTDEYWLHGGGIKNVFKTVKYGVPSKGMIAWQSQFSPSQMQKVSSYILTMQGTNPPNAKDPQGEKYNVEAVEELPSDSTVVDSTSSEEL